MKNPTVILTETDRHILESYKTIADGLADFWGNSCEVIVHSMESLDSSIIKIVNGSHSGRSVGSPITDVALNMLGQVSDDPSTKFTTYFTKNKRGENLKATISAIIGEGGNVIGLFCINFYLNTPLSSIIQSMSPPVSGASETNFSETFVDNAEDLMLCALEEAKKTVYNDLNISSSNKNKEIVSILYNKGIFNLKDSVVTISDRLGISKNTVYMHIRNLNK